MLIKSIHPVVRAFCREESLQYALQALLSRPTLQHYGPHITQHMIETCALVMGGKKRHQYAPF